MKRIRTLIILGLIMLIMTVLITLAFTFQQLLQTNYIHSLQQQLDKHTVLLKRSIEKETNLYDIKAVLSEYAEKSNADLVFLHNGTSFFLPEHLPESQATALMEGLAKQQEDVISIDSANSKAHYITRDTHPMLGEYTLIQTTSLQQLHEITQQMWVMFIFAFLTMAIIIIMLGSKIGMQFTKAIESVTKVAEELTKGNYRARTYEVSATEAGMLTKSINILARTLQEVTSQYEMQQDRLHTLIESMGSGLILIDKKGYITLINKTYVDVFQIDPKDYIHKLYYEAITHSEIVQIVEDIFFSENTVRKQVQLTFDIERRNFEVYGSPIFGANDEWNGVVLVFHDITELKRLEEMRKDFVANVSHELKTPMTSIKGFTETLLDGALEDKEATEQFLSIILKESDRLQTLIDDLLDLSKIEQEGFQLQIHSVNIAQLLENVILLLQQKAEKQGIELHATIPEQEVAIQGDEHRLQQIFMNIIQNAINYTPSGGKVAIQLINEEQIVKIAVADTGIGMSKEQIPRIFERFYRIDKARSRHSGGTGLGLAIVKHLVEAHHGEIEVESQVGQGTAFTVILKKNLFTKI